MTPPSISGTSLAPLADTDRTDNHLITNSNPGAATLPPMAATIPTIRTVLRKVPHTKQPCGVPHTGAPLTFASKAAAAAEGHKGLGGACWGDNELQLVAEGKSIARGGQVSIDPRLMMYMEINENDSLWWVTLSCPLVQRKLLPLIVATSKALLLLLPTYI